ncbi:hypothetical protein CANMA_000594 [Candida margitis]|uniref:uncharacterized protein n=1 Tax=Candida margitis TaxID=1775924 RepID=UPI0022261D86|nr:uncharacterized protein CANMA_000594 [Candida margitis]KAI5970354.1 hypothetical protein CANMA_000594 [Candida margitis]
MSFHPNHYLNGLNLEYEDTTTSPNNNNNMFSPSSANSHDLITEEDIQQHLDLFSGAANEFYSLDVVGDDTVVPIKPVQQYQQQQHHNNQQLEQQYKESFARPNQQSVVNSKLPTTHDIGLTANAANIPSPYSVASTPYTPSANTVTNATWNGISSSQGALDDKKKRNTAASARFRIKKKLKEQEMERKAKELEDKVVALEKKLKTMEMENKCLKSIIFQQNEQKNIDLLESIKKKSIMDSKSNFEYTV